MAHLSNMREIGSIAAITEQVQLAERHARELTTKLEEANTANNSAAERIGELAQERDALAERLDVLEKATAKILSAQPTAMAEALKRWTHAEGLGIAKALQKFLGEAMSS